MPGSRKPPGSTLRWSMISQEVASIRSSSHRCRCNRCREGNDGRFLQGAGIGGVQAIDLVLCRDEIMTVEVGYMCERGFSVA